MENIVVRVIALIIVSLVLFLATTTAFAYLTLFERRLLARFQNRLGPNRAGPELPPGRGDPRIGGGGSRERIGR